MVLTSSAFQTKIRQFRVLRKKVTTHCRCDSREDELIPFTGFSAASAQKVPTLPRQAIDVVREHSDVGDEASDDAQYTQVIEGRSVAGRRCSTPPWRRRRMRHQPHGSVARDEGLGFVACGWRNAGETRTASLTDQRRFP